VKNLKLIISLTLLAMNGLLAQNSTIDSLKNQAAKWKNRTGITADTSLYTINLQLGIEFQQVNSDSSLFYLDRSLLISKKHSDVLRECNVYAEKAICFKYKSDYDAALIHINKALKTCDLIPANKRKQDAKKVLANVYKIKGAILLDKVELDEAKKQFEKSIKFAKQSGDKTSEAKAYTNLGVVESRKGNMSNSLSLFFKALEVGESIGNQKIMADNLGNIGVNYSVQSDFDKSIQYHKKALELNKKLGRTGGQITNLLNIGIAYSDQEKYDESIEYYNKCLEFVNDFNESDFASVYNSIGTTYLRKKEYSKSLDFLNKALTLAEQTKDIYTQASALNNMAYVLTQQGKLNEAMFQIKKAIAINKSVGSVEHLKGSYWTLSNLYEQGGRYKDALESYKQYIEYKDSLHRSENQKAIVEKEMQYNFDKQKAEQKAKQALLDAQQSKEKQVLKLTILFVSGILLVLIVAAILIFRALQTTKKQKDIIENQKNEVEIKNSLIEEQSRIVALKNNEILSSINYAKRIQTAILPPPRVVKEFLKNSFILYLPKDIVAGDFYWMDSASTEESGQGGEVFIAACDCTGHGVPGAMVSVVCNNALNRAVNEFGERLPGKIFDKARELVLENFEKSDEEVKDGMDASLCALDIKNRKLLWAGANNPLWILRNNEMLEYKPDKQPIGKGYDNKPFTTHEISLQEGDIIYLFTDGYADQFGGEKGKKMTKARFREFVLSIAHQSMEVQREALLKFHDEYRGQEEQVDDICVIGVRV
jgi:tetratricopeptide (TPR) repeat protein